MTPEQSPPGEFTNRVLPLERNLNFLGSNSPYSLITKETLVNHYLVVYPILFVFFITTPDETVPGESMDGNLQAAGGWDIPTFILLLHQTSFLEREKKSKKLPCD